MTLRFAKMHGIGNDFIVVDHLEAGTPTVEQVQAHAVALCNRHTGVGADGILCVLPADTPGTDFAYRMFNPDGTEAEMCGNGIRCFGKWVYEQGHTSRTTIAVGTQAGVKILDLVVEGGQVSGVRVDMGAPRLSRADLPMDGPTGEVLDEPFAIDNTELRVTGVSMGNPHVVYFVEHATDASIDSLGPQIETDPRFPRRTNVHEVQRLADGSLRMLTWERGAGRTLACGTGACAVAVAARRLGLAAERTTCHLPGGDLTIEWDGKDGHVFMTGPAQTVYTAVIEL